LSQEPLVKRSAVNDAVEAPRSNDPVILEARTNQRIRVNCRAGKMLALDDLKESGAAPRG